MRRRNPEELLEAITIEECGKSRVYLGGLAESLHQRNLHALLHQWSEEERAKRQKIGGAWNIHIRVDVFLIIMKLQHTGNSNHMVME